MFARSGWQKLFATVVLLIVFIAIYDVTIRDSRYSVLPGLTRAADPSGAPVPGVQLAFSATAYCKGLVTSSGVAAQAGVMAADPALLPVGSVVDFAVDNPKYDGIYTILDTGPEIRGREVDLYIWSCYEALDFGRRPAKLTVLRLGWEPKATTERWFDRLFKKPGSKAPLPSRPLPTEQ
jgi:3D (Asp-Asp-Asp) domain-containing protein